jgi:ribulose-5-phosphate 4-epimerase/fuculose-1-phosphate aldolase
MSLALAVLALLAVAEARAAPTETEVAALKEKVALATRMLVMEGLLDASGHVSARIPGTNLVVISPGNLSRAIVRGEDIVTVDLDAHQVAGSQQAPKETEIHTAIYRARPDVMAVVHSHPVHSLAFSITGKPIVPVTVHGAIFGDGVPVMDYVGQVDSRELGDELARTLGSHHAVLLKMHGAAIAAPTVEEAFAWALHLEENAEKQLWAEMSGTVHAMSQADIERCIRQSMGWGSITKRWEFYEEKLRSVDRPRSD